MGSWLRTTVLPVHSSCFFRPNQLLKNNLLGTAADVVHGSNPGEGIGGLQVLCDGLCSCHLVDCTVQPVLDLFVELSQVIPQLAVENQGVVKLFILLGEFVNIR